MTNETRVALPLSVAVVALAAVVWFAVREWRLIRVREAMAAEKPVFHVHCHIPDWQQGVALGLEWRWGSTSCHLCAARLTTAAHYIGQNRVVCPSCYAVVNGVAA